MKVQTRYVPQILVVIFVTIVLNLAGLRIYADKVYQEFVTVTPGAEWVIVTSTPTAENIVTVAAMAATTTAQATTTGTATPVPLNWVTPVVVTSSPVPENSATAGYLEAVATAVAYLTGTFTPTPANLYTATVTGTPTPRPTRTPGPPTPIYILLDGQLPPMTPTYTPTPVQPIPAPLKGKIAFKSSRSGRELVYVMNPDGSGLALLTNNWPYEMAEKADAYSIDGRFRVFTKDSIRYNNNGNRVDGPDLYWYDAFYNVEQQLTFLGTGAAWNGVWSPTAEQIAFTSNESADDEIWIVNLDGSNLKQLTESNDAYNAQHIGKDDFLPEVNGHPTWSPDGQIIVFWSNRTGRRQLWAMDRDGGSLYNLSHNEFDDWDPVWIK